MEIWVYRTRRIVGIIEYLLPLSMSSSEQVTFSAKIREVCSAHKSLFILFIQIL